MEQKCSREEGTTGPILTSWPVPVCLYFMFTTNFQFSNSHDSQNTVLLASTQAVYKAPHSTVRERDTHRQLAVSSRTAHSSSSRKSQSVRLEHNTVEPVAASCTYASAINASKDIQCIHCVQT